MVERLCAGTSATNRRDAIKRKECGLTSLGVSIPFDRAVHLYKVFLAVLAGAIPIVGGSHTLRTMLRPGSYVDLF